MADSLLTIDQLPPSARGNGRMQALREGKVVFVPNIKFSPGAYSTTARKEGFLLHTRVGEWEGTAGKFVWWEKKDAKK